MKRRFASLCASLTVLALLASCAPATSTGGNVGTPAPSASVSAPVSTYQKIDAEAAKKLMDEDASIVVVDVRRPDEYAEGHVPGAINIPNEDIGETRPAALPDLGAPLIVYCRTGVRSKAAADKLAAMGYASVLDMGGIVDWPYEKETGEAGSETPAPSESVEPSKHPAPSGNVKPSESAASTQGPAPSETSKPEATGVLSKFSATDLDGNDVDESILADYDLTMVNVWATFCGPCLREMPELGEIHSEYTDKGFQIVGLVADVLNSDGTLSDEQVQLAKDIVAETKADYLHLLPSIDLYGVLAAATAVPLTFFVDQDGNQVGYAYSGSREKADWMKIIDPLLEEVQE